MFLPLPNLPIHSYTHIHIHAHAHAHKERHSSERVKNGCIIARKSAGKAPNVSTDWPDEAREKAREKREIHVSCERIIDRRDGTRGEMSFRHGTCRGWETKYPILDVVACGKQGTDARQETPTPCFKLWFSSAYIFSFIDYIIIIIIIINILLILLLLLLLLILLLLLFRLINCHVLKIKAKESFSTCDAGLFCFSILCRSGKFALPSPLPRRLPPSSPPRAESFLLSSIAARGSILTLRISIDLWEMTLVYRVSADQSIEDSWNRAK